MEGDPRKVIASYVIDVGKAEEAQLAREEVNRVAHATEEAAAAEGPLPANWWRQAKRQPTCSRPPKAAGARAR